MGRTATDYDDGTRRCTACGSRLPLTDFDVDHNATKGRRSHCKPCRSAKMKAWYAANRERQAARAQARRDADPDKIRAQDLARYYRNRPKRIALVEEAGHRRRALMRQAPTESGITKARLRGRDGDHCCYCGCIMDFVVDRGGMRRPDKATIEHIVPLAAGGPHSWANVALACWRCNTRKNRRTVDEWKAALDRQAG